VLGILVPKRRDAKAAQGTRPAPPLSACTGLESLPTGATPNAGVQRSGIDDWPVRIGLRSGACRARRRSLCENEGSMW
jgi:hypothetical protein